MSASSAIVTDLDIQQDVLDELTWDPEVEVTDVGVQVEDGIVTLTGTVATYADKWAAERATLRVAGVRAVASDIQVNLPGTVARSDTDIAAALADAMEWNTSVPYQAVTIKVDDGHVTLRGEVDWHFQREAAESAARRVAGVKTVSNQVKIKQRATTAAEVQTSIEHALIRSAQVDADHIRVRVDGHRVTLTGIVRSFMEKQEAEEAAWRALGVTDVVNKIQVQVPL